MQAPRHFPSSQSPPRPPVRTAPGPAPTRPPQSPPPPGYATWQALPQYEVEAEAPAGPRRAIGIASLLAAITFSWAATNAAVSATAHGLAPIGFGRLVEAASAQGWSIAPALSVLENGHMAIGFAILGLAMTFGRAPCPVPLTGEMAIFRRRSDRLLLLPQGALAMGLLILGSVLAGQGHAILGGCVEVPGVSLGGWCLWRLLVPESRLAIAVLGDRDLGFASRLEICGGPLNRTGRVTIMHDRLESVSVIEPLWMRLLGLGHLRIRYRDEHGAGRILTAPAAGRLSQLTDMAGFLNGRFQRGLSRAVIANGQTGWRTIPQLHQHGPEA